MNFFAIINGVLQLSNYNFRQFAAPSKCRLVRPAPPAPPSLRLWYHHTTTTVLRPFFRDHPDEPVPEENFWTLWCKGRLTAADILTVQLGATPSGLTSAHLHHPPFFTGRMPFLPSNIVKALKAILRQYCNLKVKKQQIKALCIVIRNVTAVLVYWTWAEWRMHHRNSNDTSVDSLECPLKIRKLDTPMALATSGCI